MTTQRPLTDAELDALEAAAEAATPGDWVAGRTVIGGSGKVRAYVYSDDRAVRATIDGSASRHDEIEADGRHLALANPATVLRLIAELRELRTASVAWAVMIQNPFENEPILDGVYRDEDAARAAAAPYYGAHVRAFSLETGQELELGDQS